jgi:hypothetical protein
MVSSNNRGGIWHLASKKKLDVCGGRLWAVGWGLEVVLVCGKGALFKRGWVRIVGEHATAKSPRAAGNERVLAFSNPRGPLAVTSTPGRDGALEFSLLYAIFLMA